MKYVLDSWAALAYLKKEKSGGAVKAFLVDADREKCALYMHKMNLAELYYIIYRNGGEAEADRILSWFRALPISFVDFSDELLFAAAKLKGKCAIAFSDCFVVATAQRCGGEILTGDPEFRKVEDLVKIQWL